MWERLLRYAQACQGLLGRQASLSKSTVACRTFQVGDAACAAAHDVLEAAHLALIAALGCFCVSADLSSCSKRQCAFSALPAYSAWTIFGSRSSV